MVRAAAAVRVRSRAAVARHFAEHRRVEGIEKRRRRRAADPGGGLDSHHTAVAGRAQFDAAAILQPGGDQCARPPGAAVSARLAHERVLPDGADHGGPRAGHRPVQLRRQAGAGASTPITSWSPIWIASSPSPANLLQSCSPPAATPHTFRRAALPRRAGAGDARGTCTGCTGADSACAFCTRDGAIAAARATCNACIRNAATTRARHTCAAARARAARARARRAIRRRASPASSDWPAR